MVLEEQILRFYLKIFSFFFILISLYSFYIIFVKEISLKQDFVNIKKNQKYQQIINNNFDDTNINLLLYKIILRLNLLRDIKIHYGKFEIKKNSNFFELINIITNPSNYSEKLTIVEGWSKRELNTLLKKYFNDFDEINYEEAIADTYFIDINLKFNDFKKQLNSNFLKIKNRFKNDKLLEFFSFNEILIIASLLEKEGLDIIDKKNIYSVIINRLNKKMKLQIDATVIYSITNDERDLDRSLTYEDLKIQHDYNTYYIYGLPPKPISYVGLKTIELIFENYKTDYLFYFYNNYEGRHVFSKDYKNHLLKLNEYRSKK